MTHRLPLGVGSVLVLGFCLGVTGCARPTAEAPAAAPVAVTVSYPVGRYVTDDANFTARTQAPDTVEVRARVTGYLVKAPFKEGEVVKKGQLLFEIDPRTYKAELDQVEAQVRLAEATYRLAAADYARARRANTVSSAAVSRQEMETYRAKEHQSRQAVEAGKASAERARLNLEFCTIRSPITGVVSRYNYTVGNLVNADQTVLTSIVSQDPMYAYFDVDEHTVLRVKALIRAGQAQSARDGEIPVWLGLANEAGFPHRGTINFIDNQVNARTGTLRVRGIFPNKDEALAPGFFGRIRVPIGFPHKALLITDRAVDTDQGQKIVYVVDRDNKVVSRPVRLGALHDGLREVTDGLKPGDRVIVNGLQQVRPGLTVEPKLVDMPTKKRMKDEG